MYMRIQYNIYMIAWSVPSASTGQHTAHINKCTLLILQSFHLSPISLPKTSSEGQIDLTPLPFYEK